MNQNSNRMPKMKVTIIEPGLYTSIQDNGRTGHQHQGVPFGGAMDKESYQIANTLVDNPLDTPVLEMTLQGAEIEFDEACQVAITGADMEPSLNGKTVASYTTLNLQAKDTLRFGRAKQGCRTYLSIRGEWQAKKWLGSFSAISQMKDHKDIPCAFHARDSFSVEVFDSIDQRIYPIQNRSVFSNCYVIRVISGPEFHLFNVDTLSHFFDRTFTVSPDSNRMGYRLIEQLEGYSSTVEEISSGIITGTIQITHSGSPMILMADAQTTGGYPRLLNMIHEDISFAAQMKPGDEVKFMLVNP